MNWANFHFLRPEWLICLIPILLLIWKLWRDDLRQGGWQSIIDPHFKSVLLGKEAERSQTPWPIVGLAIIWLTATFALAGPTWQSVEQPSEKSGQGSVILLDLSLSMLSDDLKPNRITRTRYKLIDLLKAHPEMATGMVVYAGSAHALAPISEDNQTLLSLIPHLNPVIMPAYGSNAILGLKKALSLIAGAHVKQGHLIWVLDDIEADQVDQAVKLIQDAKVTVSILIAGTPGGGPISMPNYGLIKDNNGKIVIAKIPVTRIQKLASKIDASVTLLQADDSDLSQLLPPFSSAMMATDIKDEKKLASWLDNGVYLTLLLIPLVALAYRRGWLFSWMMTWGLGLLMLAGSGLYPQAVYAETTGHTTKKDASVHLLDIFKSPDQQGYEKWQQRDYQTAVDRFEDPQWKGAALYRQGKYQEALRQFRMDKSATGHYNQGNALAQMGQFQQAKSQYQKALKLRPDWAKAQKNLALMNQLLEQKKQPPKQKNTSSKQPPSRDGSSASSSGQNPQKQAKNDDKNDLNQPVKPKQSTDTKAKPSSPAPEKPPVSKAEKASSKAQNAQAKQKMQKPSPSESDHAKKPSPAASEKGNQRPKGLAEKPTQTNEKAPSKPLTEEEQAQRAWLNQIPDDPGLFLKRKFEYQYQMQQNKKTKEPEKIW